VTLRIERLTFRVNFGNARVGEGLRQKAERRAIALENGLEIAVSACRGVEAGFEAVPHRQQRGYQSLCSKLSSAIDLAGRALPEIIEIRDCTQILAPVLLGLSPNAFELVLPLNATH
jgi:hypothetical protein